VARGGGAGASAACAGAVGPCVNGARTVAVTVNLLTNKATNIKSFSGINGVIVMIIGGWLLLNSTGIVRVGFWELFWPMILIGIGSVLVLQAFRRHTREASGADADNTLTVFAVMSGVKRTSTAAHFRGGEITAVMGGAQLDLRLATIPPGEEATLDVFAIMGGFELFVPSSWAVVTPIVPVMGAVEDKRLPALPGADSLGGKTPPRLVLRGLILMGGIEIKICTWSLIMCPSWISLSRCCASSRSTGPNSRRKSPKSFCLRYFGIHTRWYLHTHFVCARLCN